MAAPSIPAIKSAMAAFQDEEFYKYSFNQNKQGKEMIYSALDEIGLEYIKSHTNFVFFKSGRDIVKLNKQMNHMQTHHKKRAID